MKRPPSTGIGLRLLTTRLARADAVIGGDARPRRYAFQPDEIALPKFSKNRLLNDGSVSFRVVTRQVVRAAIPLIWSGIRVGITACGSRCRMKLVSTGSASSAR